MVHKSIKLNTPVEFVNITPFNPLISKCEIKVCYVSDEPNRNNSIITKEAATKMANSLPGCPIVGFYNEEKEDFEEHNRIIDISNGKFEIKDTTKPYGFVDLNAKVWFQWFQDDGMVEREYLMTEGWLWTGQYPECRRILQKGNNQSMELDEKTLNAAWTKDDNGMPEFFIINEAIISKLCTLGEDNEPCFEGCQINAPSPVQFSLEFDDGFKQQVFSMMNELKELLNKGGKTVNKYTVEVGDNVWDALCTLISEYSIDGVFEEDGQAYVVVNANNTYSRLNFSILEDGTVEFSTEMIELSDYTPVEDVQFSASAFEEYVKAKEEPEEETCPECGKPLSECECEEKEDENEDKKEKYNLDEIQEYVELSTNYASLEQTYNDLVTTYNNLKEDYDKLVSFKASIDRAEKEKMIESFSILSEEDKKDVIENIDKYSVDEIEAKLSVICVRNKINLNPTTQEGSGEVVFHLNDESNPEGVPDWVKALRRVAKDM